MSPFPAIPGPWPHAHVENRVLRLDGDRFTVAFHDAWEPCNDPLLRQTLEGWGVARPDLVPRWRRFRQAGARGVSVSMDHSWALPAWARAWRATGAPLTVVHLDRHTDCGAPLLLSDAAGALLDCLTGAPVRVDDPASLEGAVESGAIGIGGFVAPAVAAGLVRELVHVFPSRTPLPERRASELAVGVGAAHPRRPDLRWLAVGPGDGRDPASVLARIPVLAAHAADVPRGLAGPLALDLDLDYASNRLRGDPDWEDTPGPELTEAELEADLRLVLDRLEPDRIACVTVATSPRFCPAERWRALLETVSGILAERLGLSLRGLCPWEPAP